MNREYDAVKDFHVSFGVPAADRPTISAPDRIERRANWIESEVWELREARGIVDQADAYIDIIYFALGGLVEMGIRPDGLFDAVQVANMAKLWPDGKPRFREDSKILKPPGWADPSEALRVEIARQVVEANEKP